eukprot:TRINITY_DN1295_c3_g1_i1.p1 TRINITY_DN1295_c3_g1~~TRINITY_DN1295_c3_g1_i1.p1  ORF type:complete len:811 (-),score=113.19 TRINITY_DN1295_c3_g1_i1:157-2472(-)
MNASRFAPVVTRLQPTSPMSASTRVTSARAPAPPSFIGSVPAGTTLTSPVATISVSPSFSWQSALTVSQPHVGSTPAFSGNASSSAVPRVVTRGAVPTTQQRVVRHNLSDARQGCSSVAVPPHVRLVPPSNTTSYRAAGGDAVMRAKSWNQAAVKLPVEVISETENARAGDGYSINLNDGGVAAMTDRAAASSVNADSYFLGRVRANSEVIIRSSMDRFGEPSIARDGALAKEPVHAGSCVIEGESSSSSSSSGRRQSVGGRRVEVFRTRKQSDERLTKIETLELSEDESDGAQAAAVFVCPMVEVSKPFIGFGGSFTEAAAVTLQKMSGARQEEVMTAYFCPSVGLGYSLGRLHIGSCDFSLGNWTCGPLAPGDDQLRAFSIGHYDEAILPMIRRASALAGGCGSTDDAALRLMASPWSPPEWMKTTGKFNGDGRLRPECRATWALHYVRFIEEMQRVGFPIWALSVQNEPEAAQSWESCIYSGTEERDFVRDFLGPTLHDAGFGDVKVLVWDHNRDGMLERAAVAYADAEAAKYIWGVGYHWYGDARFETWPEKHEVIFEDRQKDSASVPELRSRMGFDNVRRVAELRPDKHILFTEGCQELDDRPLASAMGEWKYGERYGMNIIADLNAGCEGWIDWNLCLNETGGPNHVGNFCIAPVICDTRTDRVLFQPSFWYLGHFARFIRPGAVRVVCGASRDVLEVTAFKNVDGTLAVIVMNQSEESVDFWLKIHGCGAVEIEAFPRSICTFVVETEASADARKVTMEETAGL